MIVTGSADWCQIEQDCSAVPARLDALAWKYGIKSITNLQQIFESTWLLTDKSITDRRLSGSATQKATVTNPGKSSICYRFVNPAALRVLSNHYAHLHIDAALLHPSLHVIATASRC